MRFTVGWAQRYESFITPKCGKEGLFLLYDDTKWPNPQNDISCVYVQNGWGDIGRVGVRVFIRISSNPRLEVL